MRKDLGKVLLDTSEKLKHSKKEITTPEFQKYYLEKIYFFQHERLVHLLVTLGFAIFSLLAFCFFLLTEEATLLILGILFVMLLIPYIIHYYFLENGVQKMYDQYDELLKK